MNNKRSIIPDTEKHGKTLILKCEDGGFEQFFSEQMRSFGVTVDQVIVRHLPRAFQAVLPGMPFYSVFWKSWKKSLCEYDLIIVFDVVANLPLIKKLKKMAPQAKLVLWNWNIRSDPMDEYKDFCDIWCFDERCCRDYGWNYDPQFYFDIVNSFDVSDDKKTCLFVGFDKGRSRTLEELAEHINDRGYESDFSVFMPETETGKYVKVLEEMADYPDVLKRTCSCHAVVEILQEKQCGITTRTLEAAVLGKKLITDNTGILKSDLYEKDNIFVLGYDDYSGLEDFLSSPLKKIPDGIKRKYMFPAWLERIRNDTPFCL